MSAACFAALLALVIYTLTMSQSLGWHDSAELALAAWQLGASHAPGSPLHALLGHLLMHLTASPYIGTTLLSVLAASVTVAILAFLLGQLTSSIFAGVIAALIYAFSYQVWTVAVITEVYSLGMLFLAIAIFNAWLWQKGGRRVALVVFSLFYVLALTAYFANILLLPAFAIFIWCQSTSRLRDLALFGLIAVLGVMLIAAANILLSQNVSPVGEVLPDSLWNVLVYMSGAQHDPLQVKGLMFAAGRFWQHGKLFSSSLFFVTIPIGLFGLIRMYLIQKTYTVFIALIFAIYLFYYSLFGPGDYYMMVLPSYFIFAIWIGVGMAELAKRLAVLPIRFVVHFIGLLIVASIVLVQLPSRTAAANVMEAEQFAASAFAILPVGAVAVVGWKDFTTLRYMQEVDKARTDLRVILPARSVRHYSFATVEDYMPFVLQELCHRPVFAHKELVDLSRQYTIDMKDYAGGWQQLNLNAPQEEMYCDP